jgi:hypothetical protein
MTARMKPAEQAAAMADLQKRIDAFNTEARLALQTLVLQREIIMRKGTELGMHKSHMNGWLTKVPKIAPNGEDHVGSELGLPAVGIDGLEIPAALKR